MKLLFTGASGFLGRNIIPLLKENYELQTIGLNTQDDYVVNLAKSIPTLKEHFDIVLHAAGKAHVVPKTDAEKQVFFEVNLQGTKNLCAALEKVGTPRSLIFISTVAVYGKEYGENITEDTPLNGNAPYALSKRQAEDFLQRWCKQHNVILSILRPSLLAGINPPGNLGAMIKGIKTGRYLSIAGGRARKSVLMVQDIATLVPLLVEKGGIYNVCDSYHPTFRELEVTISRQLGKSIPLSIPYWLAKIMAWFGDYMGNKVPINSARLEKITKSLTFSNAKAIHELGWKPSDVLENFFIS